MTEPMTDERFNELEIMAQSATEGPWTHINPFGKPSNRIYITNGLVMGEFYPICPENMENARFAAASRQAIPDLIAEVRRLRYELDQASGIYTLVQHKDAEIEELQAEIEALKNPWRPIETAPRDGTYLLLFIPDYGDEKHIGFGDEDGFLIDDGAIEFLDEEGDMDNYPTHWMPLPQPPKAVDYYQPFEADETIVVKADIGIPVSEESEVQDVDS